MSDETRLPFAILNTGFDYGELMEYAGMVDIFSIDPNRAVQIVDEENARRREEGEPAISVESMLDEVRGEHGTAIAYINVSMLEPNWRVYEEAALPDSLMMGDDGLIKYNRDGTADEIVPGSPSWVWAENSYVNPVSGEVFNWGSYRADVSHPDFQRMVLANAAEYKSLGYDGFFIDDAGAQWELASMLVPAPEDFRNDPRPQPEDFGAASDARADNNTQYMEALTAFYENPPQPAWSEFQRFEEAQAARADLRQQIIADPSADPQLRRIVSSYEAVIGIGEGYDPIQESQFFHTALVDFYRAELLDLMTAVQSVDSTELDAIREEYAQQRAQSVGNNPVAIGRRAEIDAEEALALRDYYDGLLASVGSTPAEGTRAPVVVNGGLSFVDHNLQLNNSEDIAQFQAMNPIVTKESTFSFDEETQSLIPAPWPWDLGLVGDAFALGVPVIGMEYPTADVAREHHGLYFEEISNFGANFVEYAERLALEMMPASLASQFGDFFDAENPEGNNRIGNLQSAVLEAFLATQDPLPEIQTIDSYYGITAPTAEQQALYEFYWSLEPLKSIQNMPGQGMIPYISEYDVDDVLVYNERFYQDHPFEEIGGLREVVEHFQEWMEMAKAAPEAGDADVPQAAIPSRGASIS